MNNFTSALRYLTSVDTYAPLMPAGANTKVQRAAIPLHFTQQLVDAGHFEPVDKKDVRGSVFVFAVPEHAKQRFRIIQHPKLVNERLAPAPAVAFRSIRDRCQMVHAGSSAGAVDLSAYYTQFELAPDVRNFFCALLPSSSAPASNPRWDLHRLRVGPTGQSHMVHVACATTALLKDFEHHSAVHDDQIDNVLFVGDPVHVARDLEIFSNRCTAVGVTINEDMSVPSALVGSSLNWCGLALDFNKKTVSLTAKVVDKTRLSWSNRERWTWRGFAAHVGLLFYAMQVITVPVASFFNLLRFVSQVGHAMQAANDLKWDEPAAVWDCAWTDLSEWTSLALCNAPRLVPKHAEADVYVLVDSSADGWGYVALDLLTGKIFSHGERWSPDFVLEHGINKLRRSVFTEPHGILKMKCHLTAQLTGRRSFRVGTDNVAAKATLTRGFASRSYDMNNVAAVDRKNFADHQWEYWHVNGRVNIYADLLSRGGKLAREDLLGVNESLRRLLGDNNPAATSGGGGQAEVLPHTQ